MGYFCRFTAPHVHRKFNGWKQVYLRVGDKSKKLIFEQRLQFVYAKGIKYFEEQPVAGATINDIDLEVVAEYQDCSTQ